MRWPRPMHHRGDAHDRRPCEGPGGAASGRRRGGRPRGTRREPAGAARVDARGGGIEAERPGGRRHRLAVQEQGRAGSVENAPHPVAEAESTAGAESRGGRRGRISVRSPRSWRPSIRRAAQQRDQPDEGCAHQANHGRPMDAAGQQGSRDDGPQGPERRRRRSARAGTRRGRRRDLDSDRAAALGRPAAGVRRRVRRRRGRHRAEPSRWESVPR